MKKLNRRQFLKAGTLVSTGLLLSGLKGYATAFDKIQKSSSLINTSSLSYGLLDITLAPYNADPTGLTDSTVAIQTAVNYARDNKLVCFFPTGTYLISDTISCEQPVYKLPISGGVSGSYTDSCGKYMSTDGKTQHYWNNTNDLIFLLGSTKGARPVIKLATNATGFGDASNPKVAVKIWAQTRDDRGGTVDPLNPCLISTPIWGKEQPNISFNHTFKGIDIDLNGNPGAIGLRHTGSQGCYMMDSKIIADGALAGLSNCCGQGGGTYNIEVQGGQYGIRLDVDARFPILTSCIFRGQTVACVQASQVGGGYIPLVMVGCLLEPKSTQAIDLSNANGYPGINLIDSVVNLNQPGVVVKTKSGGENVFLENLSVNNVNSVQTYDNQQLNSSSWVTISEYTSCKSSAENLTDGIISTTPILSFVDSTEPDYTLLHDKHWSMLPSFEDADAVNVKDYGAVGDGTTNDSPAFNAAFTASKKVFVPKGSYKLYQTPVLGTDTQLFGLNKFSVIAANLSTVDDSNATTSLSLLSIGGSINWKAGKGIIAFANGNNNTSTQSYTFSGNGGGRIYGLLGGINISGNTMPISLYSYNVERIQVNPMSIIQNAKNVKIFYLKVEAGTIQNSSGTDYNTPMKVLNSENIRIYCVSGNVTTISQRPMVDVVNSTDVMVSQAKSFKTGDFPNLRETIGSVSVEIPSATMAALYLRNPITADITNFDELQPQVYPNPFINSFTVDIPDGYNNIEIYNSLGQKLFNQKISGVNQYKVDSLANKPSGIYFLKLNGIGIKKIFKIVKQ
jgi:hypothetical protein